MSLRGEINVYIGWNSVIIQLEEEAEEEEKISRNVYTVFYVR